MFEFQQLYEKYNRDVCSFILKLVNYNSSLAEELTQETFYQVYLSMSKFRGDSDLSTWIHAIAKNVCYRYFRKNPSGLWVEYSDRTADAKSLTDSFKTPQELLEIKETAARIHREILGLKKKYRDVMLCRLYLEMSFREISKTMHISENSAKVIYHRGIKMLKERLEGLKDENEN